ncbi:16S rRNA (guanine527-N7)-methyltransferase [Cognatiyoonia koreensis]|uniref:Ribosomal RNA small subunit methyltransferase G n=1 Tax=Cognatiyoonia koreensis TaxID=364200 RepID=A0A1I0RPG2_9RHOB|nr:16S rRNA (guanine(527)-N(7))-methyltransferase RsmG [Cognatiyoonia koreensis]SEW43144.1 16S rRNA (guanine527-N7)-methyltransferase [Cognatiyoonia koreensis]
MPLPNLVGLNVSRETIERLEAYVALLVQWNKRINLISNSTIADIWSRHIEDSAQIMRYCESDPRLWVDAGSGGGLPGIVVATILKEQAPKSKTILIESDQRKSVFLRTVIRQLDLNALVRSDRAEKIDPVGADVFSARALMSLDGLLFLAQRHLNDGGKILVLKGRTAAKEIKEAREHWNFDVVAHPSMTDNEAKILEIRTFERANP